MRLVLYSALIILLGGCATTKREAAAEALGYERGYRQAIKEQYWIIQNQQRVTLPARPNPATP